MTPETEAFDRRVRAIGASARAEAARDAAARMAGAPDSLCLANLGQWWIDAYLGEVLRQHDLPRTLDAIRGRLIRREREGREAPSPWTDGVVRSGPLIEGEPKMIRVRDTDIDLTERWRTQVWDTQSSRYIIGTWGRHGLYRLIVRKLPREAEPEMGSLHGHAPEPWPPALHFFHRRGDPGDTANVGQGIQLYGTVFHLIHMAEAVAGWVGAKWRGPSAWDSKRPPPKGG